MTTRDQHLLPHDPAAEVARAELQRAACRLVELALGDRELVDGLARALHDGAVLVVAVEMPAGEVFVDLHRGLDQRRLLTVRTFGAPS
jgi:hypothetical protein